MIRNRSFNNAFTIIELLVVLVIISILVAITYVSYSYIQNTSRMTAKETTATTVHQKMDKYFLYNGHYPDTVAIATTDESLLKPLMGGTLSTQISPCTDKLKVCFLASFDDTDIAAGNTGYSIGYWDSNSNFWRVVQYARTPKTGASTVTTRNCGVTTSLTASYSTCTAI